MLFFKINNTEDWIHHIVSCLFVPLIGILCPFGYTLSLCNINMCGIPGGIDYFLLVLVKYNIIEKMTEKKINRYLNLFIRYPIMYLCCYICLISYIKSSEEFSLTLLIIMFTGTLLHLLNSAYYCDKVIGNYHLNSN